MKSENTYVGQRTTGLFWYESMVPCACIAAGLDE